MVSTNGSTTYFSFEAFAGLKHYTPFCAQDFHPGGLCKWRAPPVLPRTSVMRLLRVWSIIPLFMHKISTRVVCVNGEHPPGSTPYFSYEAFESLKHYTPLYAQDFHPGGLCKWWAPPVLPRTLVMRLLQVWSIIPLLYAQDFHPGGLCKWCAPPVLPRTSVMRLLRVWSIIPLFMHKISTRVVCVNGKCLCCLVLPFFS